MKEYIFPFEKLDVWQMSVDLAERVLNLLEQLPQNRRQRLISQMEAAATSPAQNIAEGRRATIQKRVHSVPLHCSGIDL